MERFCSKKSGSSSSAGQPALSASDPSGKKSGSSSTVAQPALSASDSSSSAALLPVGSAEQLVVQFKCLKDVRLWLATPEVLNGSLDVSAFKEALTVLARVPKPRKEEVRPLQSKWDVARRHEGKERPLPDVIRELEQKVVNAAHQLANSVPASAAQPAATCIASAAQPASSGSEQLAKKLKREHATAGNSAEPPVVFGKLHICCGCMRCKVSEVMIVAAKLWQKAWRGYRTKLLFWRYLHLRIIRGFTTANPDVADFIAKTPLNEPRSLEFD